MSDVQSPYSLRRILHDTTSGSSFDPRVFWTANVLLITVLVIVLVWCFHGGAEKISRYITNRATMSSDLVYMERVRERRAREEEEKKQTPEQRLESLKDSFERNKVLMVVKSSDFVEESVLEMVENQPVVEEKKEPGSSGNVRVVEPETIQEEENGDTTTNIEESETLVDIENGANTDQVNGSDPVTIEIGNPDDVEGGATEEDANFTFPTLVELGSPDDEIPPTDEESNAATVELGSSDAEENSTITEHNHAFAMNAVETGAPGYIKLRLASGKKRAVPNCCAVCLCCYEEDETVVWSSNLACKHAFHEECVIQWLIKMQDGTPCPCCRQEFTDVDEHDRMRKNALPSFNVSVIHL